MRTSIFGVVDVSNVARLHDAEDVILKGDWIANLGRLAGKPVVFLIRVLVWHSDSLDRIAWVTSTREIISQCVCCCIHFNWNRFKLCFL